MGKSPVFLCAVYVVLNWSGKLEEMIQIALQKVDSLAENYELIIAGNASLDESVPVLRSLADSWNPAICASMH